jgi:hypothetical protein
VAGLPVVEFDGRPKKFLKRLASNSSARPKTRPEFGSGALRRNSLTEELRRLAREFLRGSCDNGAIPE